MAERHYSLMANAQGENRDSSSMQPKYVEKRRLFRADVLQDTMKGAGNASNHGLKTVDEAAAEDEVTEATPGALDSISSSLFELI